MGLLGCVVVVGDFHDHVLVLLVLADFELLVDLPDGRLLVQLVALGLEDPADGPEVVQSLGVGE